MPQLSDLVPPDDRTAIITEVCRLMEVLGSPPAVSAIAKAFELTVELFCGRWSGYRACNTEYHDLRHTTDVFLTMARMVHGAHADGIRLSARMAVTALTAALLHDTGYIQETDDTLGTGARYTVYHVDRSIAFMKRHGRLFHLTPPEIRSGQLMVQCTELASDIAALPFCNQEVELLAKMLGASDLVAQLSDRNYLEKLLFLYREFVEAGVGGYDSERDLLKKTVTFYDSSERRLQTVLDGADGYLMSHFRTRWKIPVNLYRIAIDNQQTYLKTILSRPDQDHRDFLKRGGIVERIRQQRADQRSPRTP